MKLDSTCRRGLLAAVATLAVIVAGAPQLSTAAKPILSHAEADAIRLLEQATWGPNEALIAHVTSIGPERFVDEQLAAPQTRYTAFTPYPPQRPATCVDDPALPITPTSYCARDNYSLFQLQREFFRNAVMAPDQLRQRVAFALSQIFVTSGLDINQAYAMQRYQQMLSDLAFGNFRDVLDAGHAVAGDGQLSRHGEQRQAGPEHRRRAERELRARGPAALLDRHGRAEPGRHAAARRERASRSPPTTRRRSKASRTCSPAGRIRPLPERRRGPASIPRYFDGPMEERSQYHDYKAKTLLDGAVAPADLTMSADLANAIHNVFMHPNVGAVHRQAADPEARHRQSVARLRRARRARLQRQRRRRARRHEGGRARDPARPRGARRGEARSRLRQAARAGAVRDRRRRARSNATSDGVFFARSRPRWGRTSSTRRRCSTTTRRTTRSRAPTSSAPSSRCRTRRLDVRADQLRQHAGVRRGIGRIPPCTARPARSSTGARSRRSPAIRRRWSTSSTALLMHGTMSSAARDAIVTAVKASARATRSAAREDRVLSRRHRSSEYQVER